jgi:hypothetical protein
MTNVLVRGVTVVLCAALPRPVAAQPPDALQEIQPAPATRSIRLRNLAPAIMAYLLSPEFESEPLVFATSRRNSQGLGHQALREIPSGFDVPDLPFGVSIEVDETQNKVTLRGAAATLDVWEKAIATLDKPLPQIAVEMQMVTLSPVALAALGTPQDALGPHRLEANAQQKLQDLIKANKAKVVTAPRATAIAGLTASLLSTTSTPTEVNLERTPFYINRSIGMTVRPYLRGDGDIDIEMAAGYAWAVQVQGEAAVPLRRAQSLAFRAHDGYSYLLYARPNFEPPTPSAAPVTGASPDEKGDFAAFIVTARVVKRSPIEEAAPQLAAK